MSLLTSHVSHRRHSWLVQGKGWDRADVVLGVSSLFGVALVSGLGVNVVHVLGIELEHGDDGRDDRGDNDTHAGLSSELIGVLCAFGFATTNAVAAVLVNSKLRGESPLLMASCSVSSSRVPSTKSARAQPVCSLFVKLWCRLRSQWSLRQLSQASSF